MFPAKAHDLLGERTMVDMVERWPATSGMDQPAAVELLPLVYDELRRIAAWKMAGERPGHTLQPTALVHEAWLRLTDNGRPRFVSRAHFFAAAAEAMRRILIESARRKGRLRRGESAPHETLDECHWVQEAADESILAIDEALQVLRGQDAAAADLVQLRYFLGMSMDEAALALGLPVRSAERLWTYGKAWLRRHLAQSGFGTARA